MINPQVCKSVYMYTYILQFSRQKPFGNLALPNAQMDIFIDI